MSGHRVLLGEQFIIIYENSISILRIFFYYAVSFYVKYVIFLSADARNPCLQAQFENSPSYQQSTWNMKLFSLCLSSFIVYKFRQGKTVFSVQHNKSVYIRLC